MRQRYFPKLSFVTCSKHEGIVHYAAAYTLCGLAKVAGWIDVFMYEAVHMTPIYQQ